MRNKPDISTDTLKSVLNLNRFELSPLILNQIEKYIHLLYEWNKKINLTAHSTEDFIQQDLPDALHFTQYVSNLGLKTPSLLDIGCGNGHLGLVLKFIHPNYRITFLDTNRKRINFIRHVCRELNLKSTVFMNQRIEEDGETPPSEYEIVVSRATWAPNTFFGYANNYVRNNGHIIILCSSKQSFRLLHEFHDSFKVVTDETYTIYPTGHQRRLIAIKKLAL